LTAKRVGIAFRMLSAEWIATAAIADVEKVGRLRCMK
jgi:hypothetical protein